MINILIVDDSDTEVIMLKHIFENEADMYVIGVAKNGEEAVELAVKLKPDLITMDINMPVMNGLEATQLIMAKQPTPIVVISSTINNKELDNSFCALQAGALSVLQKPSDITNRTFEKQRNEIISTIRNMAEIKVISRRVHTIKNFNQDLITSHHATTKLVNYEIIALGSSVGGPQALMTILEKLPKNFPVPIVIVQHMLSGFISSFSKWLNEKTQLTIKEAEDNEPLLSGRVYLAPDNYHLEINRISGKLCTRLVTGALVSGFCPSITVLLKSIAKTCGKSAIGVLLTGMGEDGAEGLLELKHREGHTLIQDKKSSIVFGMAKAALALDAVDTVVDLVNIADYLTKITSKH